MTSRFAFIWTKSRLLHIEKILHAVVAVAEAWQDPDHPPRSEATERTLRAPNRFTEEAIAFAVNQQMSLLTKAALSEWIGDQQATTPRLVGVLHTGEVPLVDFPVLLAVLLAGHHYLGVVSPASPFLLPAFVEALRQRLPALSASFDTTDAVLARAEALIAYPVDGAGYAEQANRVGIPSARQLWPRRRYSVAVLDGREDEAERDGLAEDVLLHEGCGSRAVSLLWAPADLSPDTYLESLAAFRGVFPAHPDTPGALKMQQAFLAAQGTPHAYGDGLEFLVSKGEPTVQSPGHLRWATYDSLDGVAAWLVEHTDTIEQVVVRSPVAARLPKVRPFVLPGEARRPRLHEGPDDMDVVAFLRTL